MSPFFRSSFTRPKSGAPKGSREERRLVTILLKIENRKTPNRSKASLSKVFDFSPKAKNLLKPPKPERLVIFGLKMVQFGT